MIPHLAFMVTGVGAAVANHLWQSSVFAVAAWLTALQLRRNRAHVRHGIWLAASVKFLIPFSLLINLGGLLRTHQHRSAVIANHPLLGDECCRSAVLRFAGPPDKRSEHP